MLDNQTITTNVVHSRDRGDLSWWQTTVICDLPGVYDDEDLRAVAQVLPDLAATGFETLLIRPSTLVNETADSYLPQFITHAHALGMRVIVRVFVLPDDRAWDAGEELPQLEMEADLDPVAQRIRVALTSGADGVDLGTIHTSLHGPEADQPTSPFDSAVNVALAELATSDDDLVLNASLPAEPRSVFLRHLHENWFHHLRSSALLESPWSGPTLREVITATYTARDSLGLSTPWRHVVQKPYASDKPGGSETIGWARGADESRYNAMNLFVSALPGSVYLPFSHCGGRVEAVPSALPNVRIKAEASFGQTPGDREVAEVTRRALQAREAEGLASGPLAFIDGLSWADDADVLVLISGPLLIVLNASENRIEVPRKYRLVVASDEVGMAAGGSTLVPPQTCCWFRPDEITPTDPAQYPRNPRN